MRPRLLDLFCGAGGAAMGYHRAGFEVVGVDINPQPRYPFEFVQADVLEVLDLFGQRDDGACAMGGGDGLEEPVSYVVGTASVGVRHFDVDVDENGAGHNDSSLTLVAVPSSKAGFPCQGFDAIHASPPCQDYSRALRHMAAPQPRLIDPVRDLLVAIGVPWVIENVVGADLPQQDTLDGRHGVELCGSMFGLRIQRHRLFETSFSVVAPRGCNHSLLAMNPHNQAGRDRIYAEHGRQDPEPIWRREIGVGWMTKHEGREAIPPAYTELIGHQLLQHLQSSGTAQGRHPEMGVDTHVGLTAYPRTSVQAVPE